MAFVQTLFAQTTLQECAIGDTSIQLQKQYFGTAPKGIYFINLHANETTSIDATNQYLKKSNGSFIQLKNGDVRNVRFSLTNTLFKVDPNRIFTSDGIETTLKKNSTYTIDAAKVVTNFAQNIIDAMPQPKLIIAMHNNTNNDFSISSYSKGKNEAINAAKLYINPAMDADDFIYTTELKIFNYLKGKKINVVLQKNKGFKDDGSLSVYCSQQKIPYINIEAQLGHLKEQLQMLEAISTVIEWYK